MGRWTRVTRATPLCIGAAMAWLVGSGASVAEAQSTGAKTQARPPASARSAAIADSLQQVAKLREEEQFYHARMLEWRKQYLARASWASMGDRCAPGALRIFPSDTTALQRDSLQQLVRRMEQTIIGRGAGDNVDTPDGRKLLRVIVGWEAGIDRPHWDSDEKVVRDAFAAGLTGEYPDPNGPGCLTAVTRDTVTVVAPGFSDMIFPGSPKVRIKAYFGPQGVNRARDEFAAAHLATPGANLSYLHISPFVMWRDWAIVVVTRPLEERGVSVGARNDGGAVYLMHKVGTEWRLLSVVRSWGS